MSTRAVMGGLKERYPSFFAHGDEYLPLTREDEVTADFDRRLRAVWPFIVTKIQAFHARLKPRERASFDPEDIGQELWIALKAKDHKWTPERGRYITFVGTIVRHEFCAIREKSHTVRSPRNAGCRLQEYEQDRAAGTLSDRRARTKAAILQSASEYETIDNTNGTATGDDSASDRADCLESEAIARDAIFRALPALTPYEAVVVGASAGLWGREPKTLVQIARDSGRTADEVGAIRRGAYGKIRDRLRQIRHLSSAEDE